MQTCWLLQPFQPVASVWIPSACAKLADASSAAAACSAPSRVSPRITQAGGLGNYLSDPSQLFMVFAPDNIAWNSFFEGGWFVCNAARTGVLLQRSVGLQA